MADSMVLGHLSTIGGMRDVRIRCDRNAVGKPLSGWNKKQIGRFGEDLAAFYLEQCGLRILNRNWTCRFGEADIVAEDDKEIVLVEVKTRNIQRTDGDVAPELAVNSQKRRRYEKMALMYLANCAERTDVRFDVIAICLLDEHESYLRHLAGAYEWDD